MPFNYSLMHHRQNKCFPWRSCHLKATAKCRRLPGATSSLCDYNFPTAIIKLAPIVVNTVSSSKGTWANIAEISTLKWRCGHLSTRRQGGGEGRQRTVPSQQRGGPARMDWRGQETSCPVGSFHEAGILLEAFTVHTSTASWGLCPVLWLYSCYFPIFI